MRFSAVVSLCAAPLALAGTLQQDLIARGVPGLEVAKPDPKPGNSDSSKDSSSSGSSKSGSSSGSSGSDVVLVQQSITEDVIIIWLNQGGGAATQTVTDTVTVTQGSGSTAAAATHTVTVGGSPGLVYSPDTIEAAVGDMVLFTFMSQNHTVTQSAFTSPCVKLAGGQGLDSGFMPNPNNTVSPPPQIMMQVLVSTPTWYYCRQKGHCGQGMTFSINPTANKTQADFAQMAIAQNGTGSASPITGGTASSVIAPAASAPPASPPPAATSSATGAVSSGTIVAGSGSIGACSCFCGVAEFPLAVQGIAGFGGMSGAMPAAALMV